MSNTTTEVVVTGDIIPSYYPDPIIGHGVLAVKKHGETRYIATVSGTVQRINKLITVTPRIKRYNPEIGDVVVGRVIDVIDKRWRLDINSRQAGILNISSINLPGSQRRRTDEDVLQMRSILKEQDVVSAEVQKINLSDHSAQLHTRSHRYGKLLFGMLVECNASLIVRAKQHFHHIEALGIEVIIGVNGCIWIGPYESDEIKRRRLQSNDDNDTNDTSSSTASDPSNAQSSSSSSSKEFNTEIVTDEILESMARLRNAIRLLDITGNAITVDTILFIYNESVTHGLNAFEMTQPQEVIRLTQHVKLHADEA